MPGKNIFEGGSYQAQFSLIIYRLLMSRKWITNGDIMADFLSCESSDKLPTKISRCEGYGELKKAFGLVRKAITETEGKDSISERGNLKNKEFCYVGNTADPLSDMVAAAIEAKYKKNLEDYFQFCQDSAGFFPTSWIEHFFADTLDIFQINKRKTRGKELMGSSMDRKHKNIEWLPFIYECIRDKRVLSVTYLERFQDQSTIIFHPHYLKEFNGRWHIFGHAEDRLPCEGFNVPLDRIVEKPSVLETIGYIEPQEVRYPDFFNDIVGTTLNKYANLCDIAIRIYDRYMFGLITTKPIHRTQETSLEYNDNLGYGEVRMRLRPNNEFYGRVLQMGHDLEIISPQDVRNEIFERILKMYSKYKENRKI